MSERGVFRRYSDARQSMHRSGDVTRCTDSQSARSVCSLLFQARLQDLPARPRSCFASRSPVPGLPTLLSRTHTRIPSASVSFLASPVRYKWHPLARPPSLVSPASSATVRCARAKTAQSSFVPHPRRAANPPFAISDSLLHIPPRKLSDNVHTVRLSRQVRFQHVPSPTALAKVEQHPGCIPSRAPCALRCTTTAASPVCSQRLHDDASSRAPRLGRCPSPGMR